MQIEITKRTKIDLPFAFYAEPGDRFRGCLWGECGVALICGGHGIHASVPPDAYVIIKERRIEYRVNPLDGKEI